MVDSAIGDFVLVDVIPSCTGNPSVSSRIVLGDCDRFFAMRVVGTLRLECVGSVDHVDSIGHAFRHFVLLKYPLIIWKLGSHFLGLPAQAVAHSAERLYASLRATRPDHCSVG
jgi:hypothetical protein